MEEMIPRQHGLILQTGRDKMKRLLTSTDDAANNRSLHLGVRCTLEKEQASSGRLR